MQFGHVWHSTVDSVYISGVCQCVAVRVGVKLLFCLRNTLYCVWMALDRQLVLCSTCVRVCVCETCLCSSQCSPFPPFIPVQDQYLHSHLLPRYQRG